MAGPIRIAILADEKNALRGLDNTSRATTSLGSKFGSLAKSALKYAAAGAVLGAGAAVVGLGKLAAGAAEDEQAAKLLEKALRNSAGATDAQVAATEAYISKVGAATGVTDDELRPALSKLVTATGSVEKAQQLSTLALDVAAGSGKSLETVTTALAKAQGGSLTSLNKLAPGLVDASDKSLTLADATDALGKKFGGAAATKADTLQGKIDRLKVIASEFGETIGYKVIPPATKFGEWLLSKAPAVGRFATEMGEKLAPAVRDVGSFITGTLLPGVQLVGPIVLDVATKVISLTAALASHQTLLISVAAAVTALVAIQKINAAVMAVTAAGGLAALIKGLPIVTSATKAYAAGQAALNFVLTANPIGLVIVAIAALVAGVVIAYKKSETFRDVVSGALNVVKNVAEKVAGFFTGTIPGAFNTIVNAAQRVLGYVKDNWPTILAVLTGPIGIAVLAIVKNWDKIRDGFADAVQAVRNRAGDLVEFVRGLPGRILGGLGNVGSLLLNAGRSVIQGLIDGIEEKIQVVKDKLAALTSLIPKLKGPPARDKILLRSAGQLIIQGLIDGIDDKRTNLVSSLRDVTRTVAATRLGGLDLGTSATPGAVAALRDAQAAQASSSPIEITLTADAMDELSAGRRYRLALDAWDRAGGRRVAMTPA